MKLFLVIGLGQFGRQVATTLHAGGGEVLGIDQDERRVDEIKESVAQAVCMDATGIDGLRAIGAHKAKTAVVALGETDLEASVLCCAALSDIGVGTIIVRAGNDLHGRILLRVGATQVVYPEREMGTHIGQTILMSGVIDQWTLSTGQVVAQIRPRTDLVGRTLKDAQLRARFGINVIGIQHESREVDDSGEVTVKHELEDVPGPEAVIAERDVLIVVGRREQIRLVTRTD